MRRLLTTSASPLLSSPWRACGSDRRSASFSLVPVHLNVVVASPMWE